MGVERSLTSTFQIDRQTDRQTDCRIDTDRQTDGNRQTDRQMCLPLYSDPIREG